MEIKLQNITKIFQAKDKTETVAVKSLDITIPNGKLIGLLGLLSLIIKSIGLIFLLIISLT